IQKLHADLQKQDKSRSTVERVHRVLHNALNQALAWGYIHRNVASVVHPPTPQAHKLRTLTPEQVRRLLDTARGTRWEALLMLAIATGMRQGELLGLKWEDIDFEMGTLRVQRQLAKGRVFTEPKTRTARRAINLPRTTVAVLQAHRQRQRQERQSVGTDWADQDLVFCTHQGTPLNARNVIRDFKILLERARLPDIRFHDLRHTAATLMLLQGVAAKVVQGRLGHSQISLTLDTYSHLLPTMDREAANALDELLR
ncbi:MAG: site-specific integrase, partial [Chloroflexota bacterium]|nr:site-specific integrase [Chloroflexota bacterium]